MVQIDGKPRVRWGIIGPGNIARYAVAPAIRYSSNGILQVIASRSSARAAAIALETGASSSCGGYDKLLERDDIDAVYIGLPNGLHEEWVVKAAAAGKHVLCEKSLALTGAAARRMKSACTEAGVLLMEAFMYRHHPQWYHVRDLMYEGRIGELRQIVANLSGTLANPEDHRWSAEIGGGALYDVTCYGINVSRYITGREPIAASARMRRAKSGVDETSHAILEFDGGVLASVQGSLVTAPTQLLRLIGTEGEIIIDRPFIPNTDPTIIRLIRNRVAEEFQIGGANHFLHQVEHFANCVIGPSPLKYPGEDGVANTIACELVAKSAAAG